MSSSVSSGSGGGKWKSEVYFDPESDSPDGAAYFIKDYELRTKLAELIEIGENIEKIWVYSHKLYGFQIWQGMMYHAFVVLETNRWYWSIEKNSEGITIQRSKKLAYVKSYYRRKSRNTPITERDHDDGRMLMKDLIDWLYKQNELNRTYSLSCQSGTCQGFAKRIFNHFAKKKYSNIGF